MAIECEDSGSKTTEGALICQSLYRSYEPGQQALATVRGTEAIRESAFGLMGLPLQGRT